MGRYFLPQRNELNKDENLTPEMIEAVNWNFARTDNKMFEEFGVDFLHPEDHKDEPGKTPRLFVLKDGKVTTLAENNIQLGSKEFWETAMKGQLFGYKLGGQDPVQIQAWMGSMGMNWDISAPLGKEAKFPSEPEKPRWPNGMEKPTPPNLTPVDKPDQVAEPGKEPPRPGFFTRLGAAFGIKSSKAKVQAHTNWEVRTQEYPQKFKEYEAKLKVYQAYESELQSYAARMRNYHSNELVTTNGRNSYPGKMAEYKLEHEAWKKELDGKADLDRAREESAKAIAAALGKTRSEDVLKAEKEEAALRGTQYGVRRDRVEVDLGIQHMLSMYGSKPYPIQKWLPEGRYDKESFQQLAPIDISGLTLGEEPKPITDEEFGAIAMFAAVTPENGKALAKASSPPITDYAGTVKVFEGMGYTPQEVDELSTQFVGVVTTELFRPDSPRNPMTSYIGDFVQPARMRGKSALEAYQKGRKGPLAEIIARGIEYTEQIARMSDDLQNITRGTLRMADHMVDLMERDPELKALATKSFEGRENAMCARHKDFSGPRTMEDMVQNLKGYRKLLEFRDQGSVAREKLLLNQAGKVQLTPQEKKECIRDVMRQSMMDTTYKTQADILTKKSIQAMEPSQEVADRYLGDPELSAVSPTLQVFIQPRYTDKKVEGTVAALDMVQVPAAMKAMDKGLDKLIDGALKDPGMSLDKLRDKIVNPADKTYEGKNLLDVMKQRLTEPLPDRQGPERDRQTQLEGNQLHQPKLTRPSEPQFRVP